MVDDLAFSSLAVLGGKLRAGEVSSVELTKFFLSRLEKFGSRYNCVVNITREIALADAAKADEELKSGKIRGPLHGIPYGAKDLLATKGIPTTWGCAPFKDRVFDQDAAVVTKLREAGAILAAKLSMVELAGGMGYRQANASLTGPGRNPWKPSQWSGGSSSGSGSAVAAGLVPFAIGTETWGSITVPSSFCGITGLRPTYGRVSKSGAMALSWTLDKIGPMARNAHDCGTILNAIAGHDPDDPSTTERPYQYPSLEQHAKGFKIAVIKGGVDKADPEVKENFNRALDVFKTFATIDEIEIPDLPFSLVARTVLSAEAAAVDAWFAPYDAVLTLPTADTAPTADGPFGGSASSISLGGPGNVCGTPAIVVPSGLTKERLPTAIQLDGRAYSENRLIALAVAFQNATAWHLEHPEIV